MTRTPNQNLTTGEEEALTMYQRLTKKARGEPPTVRALAAALGTSSTATQYLLTKLREKGALTMPKITIVRSRVTAKGRAAR
jgi:DNA-binding IscR family transcriptional regulator